jgi:hypothetical protein
LMPYGVSLTTTLRISVPLIQLQSRVIAIKCNTLDDILLSHQIGLWATNRNVMDRIMELHNSRDDPSMKTLFLWSMPGRLVPCIAMISVKPANTAQQELLWSCRASGLRCRRPDRVLGQG